MSVVCYDSCSGHVILACIGPLLAPRDMNASVESPRASLLDNNGWPYCGSESFDESTIKHGVLFTCEVQLDRCKK